MQLEALQVEAMAAVRPLAESLWQALPLHGAGAAGWAAESIATIVGCLNPQCAYMCVETLTNWQAAIAPRAKAQLSVHLARIMRTIAQADGFRTSILADAYRSEHQRLLGMCLALLKEWQESASRTPILALNPYPVPRPEDVDLNR